MVKRRKATTADSVKYWLLIVSQFLIVGLSVALAVVGGYLIGYGLRLKAVTHLRNETLLEYGIVAGEEGFDPVLIRSISDWMIKNAVIMLASAVIGFVAICNKWTLFFSGFIESFNGQELVMLLFVCWLAAFLYGTTVFVSLYTALISFKPEDCINVGNSPSVAHQFLNKTYKLHRVNKDVQDLVHYVQRKYEVCGLNGPTDFNTFRMIYFMNNTYPNCKIPLSCLPPELEASFNKWITCNYEENVLRGHFKSKDDKFKMYGNNLCNSKIKEWIGDGFSFFLGCGIGIVLTWFAVLVGVGLLVWDGVCNGQSAENKPNSVGNTSTIACWSLLIFNLLLIFVGLTFVRYGSNLTSYRSLTPEEDAKFMQLDKAKYTFMKLPSLGKVLTRLGACLVPVGLVGVSAVLNAMFSMFDRSFFQVLRLVRHVKGHWPMVFSICFYFVCAAFLSYQFYDMHQALIKTNATIGSYLNDYAMDIHRAMQIRPGFATAVDFFQDMYECCGLVTLNEYHTYKTFVDESNTPVLPKSCFKPGKFETTSNKKANYIYQDDEKNIGYARAKNCGQVLDDWRNSGNFLLLAALVVAPFFVMSVVAFSVIWHADPLPYKHFRDDNSDLTSNYSNRSSSYSSSTSSFESV